MFIRYPSKNPEISMRHLVPNMITATALCCGLAAIHSSLRGRMVPEVTDAVRAIQFKEACLFVAASAVLDTLDGLIARRLRATSNFGTVLDSLSDFLSFGIAPAIIIYQWLMWVDTSMKAENLLGVIPCMLFALCSALRLARFTAAAHAKSTAAIRPPTPSASALSSMFFVGIPTPAAAGVVLIPVLLYASKYSQKHEFALVLPTWVVMALTVFVALFMVSRQPMFSIKKLRFSRTLGLPLLLCAVIIVGGIFWDATLTVAAMACLYLATFPIAIWKHHSLSQKAQREEAELPEGQPSPT